MHMSFIKTYFNKIKEKGLFGKLVDHIILLCNSNLSIQNMGQLFQILVDFGLDDKEDRWNFLDLFHETIEGLEPEVKEIVLYQMKLSAERRFEIKKTIFLGAMKINGLTIGMIIKI